jgi:hypothetical protein
MRDDEKVRLRQGREGEQEERREGGGGTRTSNNAKFGQNRVRTQPPAARGAAHLPPEFPGWMRIWNCPCSLHNNITEQYCIIPYNPSSGDPPNLYNNINAKIG